MADYSNLQGLMAFKVADWVVFQTSIQGHFSEWMMGIMKKGNKAVLVDSASNEIVRLDTLGLPNDNSAYGAAWAYQGRIFFASNDGEGVYEADVASIDLEGKHVAFEKVGSSAPTNHNDGLNCMVSPAPDNWVPSFLTTTTTIPSQTGECTVYGDPHIVGFDRKPSALGFLGTDSTAGDTLDSAELGDRWLVRSSLVHIQGRYNSVDPSRQKVFLKGLAVGGPFLQNNTLFVSHNRKMSWNDEAILTTLPSRYMNRLISASFYEDAMLVQDPTRQGHAPGLDVSLPLNVNLHVTEGKNGLGVRINMPPLSGGQDGLCGNFNGLGSDDTPELVSRRLGAHIAPAELLFRHSFAAA